ncbi:aminotransferase class IV [Streptomyces sp. NPDC006510]|uniref:aminotransferase class IV n=1 Tax=Streptomyces sp. NPDC006510 TaxID=3155600 RepID=UPI0033A5D524
MTNHPDLIWLNDRICPWDQARVHVTSETALRGVNVFEGIRGYWQAGHGRLAVVRPAAHLARLEQSAALMRIPHAGLDAQVREGMTALLARLAPRHDVYLRPTLYVEDGRYTDDPDSVVTGLYITCVPAPPRPGRAAACRISTWMRIPDRALPTAAKTGAAYAAFRLARLQAQQDGADEAILLNERGLVAETGGAAVFAVMGGTLVTPPLGDGLLDSVTRGVVLALADRLGFPAQVRSLPPDELIGADEVFLTGTLDEIRPVASIDGQAVGDGTTGAVTGAVRRAYLAMCTGQAAPLDAMFTEVLA